MARFRTALALGAVLLAVSSPALANGSHHGGGHHGGGAWQGGYPGAFPGGVYYPVMPYQGVYTVQTGYPQNYPQSYPQPYPQGYPAPDPHWQDMMERCSQGREHADSGVGGAVIGGIVGGVVGNRVADGDRTLGTVAGAAIGAVAGAAIDKGEDHGEDRGRMRDLREECDAFFAQHQGYAPGAGYGYPGYVMVPVMLPAQKPCVETTTVTEEWVNVPTRRRVIHRRAAPHHDKRVKEKRVYTGS